MKTGLPVCEGFWFVLMQGLQVEKCREGEKADIRARGGQECKRRLGTAEKTNTSRKGQEQPDSGTCSGSKVLSEKN